MPVSDALVGLIDGQLSRIMELALQHLDMDLAFVSEFVGDQLVCRALGGDTGLFNVQLGDQVPLASAYSGRMVIGEIPNAIPDTAADSRVRDLPGTVTAGIGAYIGVPLLLSEGGIYGSFCCLSHRAHDLGDRDVRFMQMLGDVVTAEVITLRDHDREVDRISKILRSEALDIALQPIFDIHEGRCLGMEALARFPTSSGAVEDVFASATSVGLGVALERLALARAISVLPLLRSHEYLSANLTPQAAKQLSSVGETRPELLSRLVLEITEHEAIDSYADLRRALQPSRELGLRLAIDDAGAGFASLKHVVELEPDLIKIDSSLVHGSSRDRARRSAISAFVLLALDIGGSVIAEGVEDSDDFETVRDLGVDAVQGYFLARPTIDRTEVAGWQQAGSLRLASGGTVGPIRVSSGQDLRPTTY
jgi:EAL domain-containing protein (putative c-di-GMP-specific phosphodiesterase class I)